MTEFRKIKARGHTHTPMSRCGASAIHYNIKRNLYSPAVQVTTNPFLQFTIQQQQQQTDTTA